MMGAEKPNYQSFLETVDIKNKAFVDELNKTFLDKGCKIDIKEAKSGYVVSYILNKKTVANYVFRKSGIIIRIYANHIIYYMQKLEELPDSMIKAIQDSPVCKRLINPDDCNPKCAMGYDFILKGERHQKCRYNAFMFLLNDENNAFIKNLVIAELDAAI